MRENGQPLMPLRSRLWTRGAWNRSTSQCAQCGRSKAEILNNHEPCLLRQSRRQPEPTTLIDEYGDTGVVQPTREHP